MYNQNPNQPLFTLRINENMKIQLRGAAVVAGISAILSLVNTIISLVNSFMEKKTTIEYQYEGFQTNVAAQKSGNVAGSIIMLIISILLFYFLNRFSSQTKQGLSANNQQMVTNGLGGLSSYFVTVGILLIIALVFVLIALAAILSTGGR
jgi:small-conductance mechanosensitive channel